MNYQELRDIIRGNAELMAEIDTASGCILPEDRKELFTLIACRCFIDGMERGVLMLSSDLVADAAIRTAAKVKDVPL